MPYATSLPIAIEVRQSVNTIDSAMAFTGLHYMGELARATTLSVAGVRVQTHTSKVGWTCDSQELNGRPPSRAKDLRTDR